MRIIMIGLLFFISCTHQKHRKVEFHDTVDTNSKKVEPKNHSNLNEKFLSQDLNLKDWEKDFEDHKRDVIINRKKIVKALSLNKGDSIADVGAGTGSFLSSLIEQVGEQGKVFAVEISSVFMKHLNEKKIQKNWNQLEIIKGEFDRTNLKENSLDVILLVDTYHHFDRPQEMLSDFMKVLKKGGKLAIVDFDKHARSREWVKHHLKLDKKGYIQEVSQAGFKFMKQEKIPFKENFMLTFLKI